MARYVISEVALENGEVDRCRVHAIIGGTASAPQYQQPGNVLDAEEVIDMIDTDGEEVFVLRVCEGQKLPPHRVRFAVNSNGKEFLESHVEGTRTESLHSAPSLRE